MGPPISAFPMTPSTPAITIAAAGDAVREVKKRRYATSKADEERLKRRSNRMAQEFQGAMEKSVKRKLNAMSGSQNNRKLGLKVAQFIPGKGLEVAGAQVENDPTLYCKLGLKSDKHVDPLDETFARIKGRQVSMDFAFKLVNPCDNLLAHDKDTRVTAINCFRHVNPDSFNFNKTGWSKSVISANGGFLFDLVVTNPGEYTAANFGTIAVTASISGGGGSGAQLGCCHFTQVGHDANGNPTWGVTSVDLLSPGSGYTSVPSITFTVGAGTTQVHAATATVKVDDADYTKTLANANWHTTLGPDASLIRIGDSGISQGNSGSAYAGTLRGDNFPYFGSLDQDPTAASNTLMSPFRYPNDMEIMYSRLNRQLLENYGWMLNPFKFLNPTFNSPKNTFYNTPDVKTLQCWSNPTSAVLDFHDTTTDPANLKSSYPAQVNVQTGAVTSQQNNEGSIGAGYEWFSQFGPGKLSYQFSNDGTNPVCIDMCIVGIKKDSPVPVHLLQEFCQFNYAVHKYANRNSTNLNGFQSSVTNASQVNVDLGNEEWHKNAKIPFMPDACFKNPTSYLKAVQPSFYGLSEGSAIYNSLMQGKSNPFKVIKRDQFIVSSGSTRAWNTTLPGISYRPQLYEEVTYPLDETWVDENDIVTTADEYTFVLCIGASGMPKPVEEIYSSEQVLSFNDDGEPVKGAVDTKTIIDRQPSTCNVSVVGTYKETVYPCFPKDRTSVNFINGRLTEPYFTTPPGLLPDNANTALPKKVTTVDISQLGQVVHTTKDGIVGVGAINTTKGA